MPSDILTTEATIDAAQPAEVARSRRLGTGRILLLVLGSIATLIAIALLVGGGVLLWANSTRDADGFFTTSSERFSTTTYALASENLDLASDAPGWLFGPGRFGDIRLTGEADGPAGELFIGIAAEQDAARYLAGVDHDVATDVNFDSLTPTYVRAAGKRAPALPATQTFWEAYALGPATQELTWELEPGNWTVVVMNADARPGLDVEMSFGANIGFVLAVGLALVSTGGLLLAGGILMIFLGGRRRRADTERPESVGGAPAETARPR